MKTLSTISPDGICIAYDHSGAGPALVLLHGGGNGSLDLDSLSQNDRELLQCHQVPVMMAWGRAMLGWPAVQPADFRCPALWLVGSEDRLAMISVREFEQSLKGSMVQLHLVEGITHGQVFDEIDRVFAAMLAFTQTAECDR